MMHRALAATATGLALYASACRRDSRALVVAVHLLHFGGSPKLSTRTTDQGARSAIAEVNRIWRASGVSLDIVSIRAEEGLPDTTAIRWLETWQPAGDELALWTAIAQHLARVRPPEAESRTLNI